jgi:hypothetical protein
VFFFARRYEGLHSDGGFEVLNHFFLFVEWRSLPQKNISHFTSPAPFTAMNSPLSSPLLGPTSRSGVRVVISNEVAKEQVSQCLARDNNGRLIDFNINVGSHFRVRNVEVSFNCFLGSLYLCKVSL